MKKIFLTTMIGFLGLSFLASCSKDSSELTQDKPYVGNLTEVAIANPQLTTLVSAVVKADLATTLSDPSLSATVFAPTNEAFSKLPAPFNTAANIDTITDAGTIATLRNILLYHAVGAEISKSQVPAGKTTLVSLMPAAAGTDNNIYVSNSRNNIVVNGVARVQRADLQATNGVIHIVDDVLIPSSQTIAQIAIGNPAFSTLVSALVKTNLAGVFGGTDHYTVFAPTNDAFALLPAPFNSSANIDTITDPATIAALANILKYHGVAGNNFAWDLGTNGQITTLADAPNNTLRGMQGFDNGKVQGISNDDFIEIYPANILANNGVIHVIGQVLLP